MRLSIGVAQHEAPIKTGQGVAGPDLILAFGRMRLDQRRVHRGLCEEHDDAAKLFQQLDAERNPFSVRIGSTQATRRSRISLPRSSARNFPSRAVPRRSSPPSVGRPDPRVEEEA
jgi:hypothetical protein